MVSDGFKLTKKLSYIFRMGALHYRVPFSCWELDDKKFVYVEMILENVDFEPRDPNVNYDRLKCMKCLKLEDKKIYTGYGVVKDQAYAFKTLANLAGILKDIQEKENPDEFRCLFTDTKHSNCWRKFFEYIAKSTQAIREITVESSQFHLGGEEWVVSLNKYSAPPVRKFTR